MMPSATPCARCGTITTQRCGRCKCLRLCSKECMKAVWKDHKPDCNNISTTSKALGDPESPQFEIQTDLMVKLVAKSDKVRTRYGMYSPPDRGSTMDTRKKIEFYLDMLDANDSSSEEYTPLPLRAKLVLNRRFNNMYRHAVEHLTIPELNRLGRERHIGEYNKTGSI